MKNNKKIYLLISTILAFSGCKDNTPSEQPSIIESETAQVSESVSESISIEDSSSVDETSPSIEDSSSDIIVSGEVNIIDCFGYEEGLFVTFEKIENAKSYNVYYCLLENEEYQKVDSMLIREYQDCMRVDILGLKAGNYNVKVCPIIEETEDDNFLGEVKGIEVISYNREGFAFSNNQVPGAYNLDGTLKDNAVVLYLTEQTKDKMKLDVVTSSKGSSETFVGLQNILNGFKKGYDKRPVCIRVIGKVTDLAVLESGDIVIDGGSKHNAGLTIEGVGTDATAFGFGIRIKNARNIEIRNIATMAVDSNEGDNIGLQQNNEYIWIHDNDFFYGDAGSDSDQAKGDGALDCKKSNFVTMSYNHFFDTGKANLLGNNGGEVGYLITYHHNWYDHSDSRHPRVRQYSAHVYNNYYDGNSKYGIGNTQGGSVFSEANYFRNCKYPMLISKQGSDIAGDNEGTFSGEDGGIIKSFNNYIEGAKSYVTYQENNKEFDAYEASSKDEIVPNSVVTKQGSHTYDNFDTNESIMYEYNVQTPIEAKEEVIAKAGRLDGGDFKWTFTEADDTSYDVDI